MVAARSLLATALWSLIEPVSQAENGLRMVIRGAIADTPPTAGSRVKVCVSVFVDDFVGGEGCDRTFCVDTTTNEAGQFTAALLLPPHWRTITDSEVNLADRCWTGNVPAHIERHRDDATGEQTADVTIAYE
jgi:hypothetical protein